MKRYLGLDVHSKRTVFCVQDEAGDILAEGSAATTAEGFSQIVEALRVGGATRIAAALETGTQAKWAARRLAALGVEAAVFEAGEVRRKARRVGAKSDKRDALELCDGLRRGQFVTRVWIPGDDIERLRRLLSRRRHMVREKTRQVNAAKFVLRSLALDRPKTLKTAAAWKGMLARQDVPGPELAHLALHRRVWDAAHAGVAALDKELAEAIKPFAAAVELLESVPGVGPVVAATFVAVVGDPKRFETGAQVASYVGLAPWVHDSGESQRRGSITKRGSAMARAALVEAAQHARRPAHPLNPYWAPIMGKSGRKKANVAIAQRLSRILWRVWRDGKRFDWRRLNVECDPKTTVRKTLFRRKQGRGSEAARA